MGMHSNQRQARRRAAAAAAGIAAGIAAAMAWGVGSGAGTAHAQVYAIALPDPTNKNLTVRPETVRAGEKLEIVSAVQNKGAGALTPAHSKALRPPALTVRFRLLGNVKDTSGMPAGRWGLNALDRREVRRRTVIWTVPRTVAPGRYFLCADVDPEDNVRESNEHNNRTCLLLTVEAPPERAAEDSGPESPAGPETSGDNAPAAPASDESGSADNPPEA